tara:strand:- start:757 stop:1338 length:582 start_codon:yes stop_codon:yes gene_type:complete
MKKFIYLFLLYLGLFLTSCEKEPLEDETIEITDISNDTISVYGKYRLISGKMYITNLVTNEKKVYNHFGPGKNTSSLRYSGTQYPIEEIIKDVTTWEITPPPNVPGHGEFILNDDYINPYGFNVTRHNWSVVEHPLTGTGDITQKMGGSAKPLEGYLLSKADSTVVFTLQQGYENIGGYNSTYLSELTFKMIQ